jgi:hypothetical protein
MRDIFCLIMWTAITYFIGIWLGQRLERERLLEELGYKETIIKK